jgi:hypothetical protein
VAANGPPPEPPHQFWGTVTVGVNPADEGTKVEAYVNDAYAAETTVDNLGRYGYVPTFFVPGTAGATVKFYVGTLLASPTAIWELGGTTNLNLTIAAPPPTVTGVNPNSGTQGQAIPAVILTGTNFTGATSVSFGAGITVNSFIVNLATQITANIAIDGAATVGARTVSVTTPVGTGTLPGGFTVNPVSPAPTVTSVNPNSGTQGQAIPAVIITGTNFTGATSVSFGAGITVNSFTFNSATQITANISIAGAATVGARTVSVTTPAGTGTLPNGFTVNAASATQKLIGADDATPVGGYTSGALILFKCQAIATGDVTEIRVKGCGTGTTFKIGIYADASGSPTTLLGYNNTATASSASWQAVALNTPVAVTSGTFYWLGISAYGINAIGYTNDTCTVKYKFPPGDMPGPAGTGYSNGSSCGLIAGWGIAPGPPTPTPLSPAIPITFSWTASTGATKYQLQVNTSSDFSGTTSLFDSEVTATTQVVAVPIGTTCYWHVRAGMPWSAWSPTGTVSP